MPMVFDISKYFTALKIAKRFEKMQPLPSTVMDRYFPEAVRTQYEGPIVPVSEIDQTVGVQPVVRRDGSPIPITGRSQDNNWIEPLPIVVSGMVTAKELNDLKLIGEDSREAWAARKQEAMRRTVKTTTEALCAQAVYNGKIAHRLRLDDGTWEEYSVTYLGQDIRNINVAAAAKWNAAECTLVVIHKLLRDMAKALDLAGYGGDKFIDAAPDAFDALLTLVEGTEKPKIPVRVQDDGSVRLGSFVIREMAEAWVDPKDKATIPKIPAGEIRMVAKGYAGLIYATLDDLDANLKPLPMFIKPIEKKVPSGYMLVGESKPLPVVAPGATCRAVVIG